MKTFRTFVKEETTPTSGVTRGVIDVNNEEVRATINAALGAAFGQGGISSPLQALNVARKVLANYHIFLPNANPPATNRGQLVFPADQFGAKVGMNDDGRVVAVDNCPYSIVLKYNVVFGRFWATCEIVSNGAINEDVAYEEKKSLNESEQLDELSKKTIASYYKKRDKQAQAINDKAEDMYDLDDDEIRTFHKAMTGMHKAAKRLRKGYPNKKVNEEQLDEISKSTLKSYIKKASHDVATKSAATGRYGERSRVAQDKYKARTSPQPWTDYNDYRKNDETADKFFKKSWKRRKGIEKAVDKLAEAEQLDELSVDKLKDYNVAALRNQQSLNRKGALSGNKSALKQWNKRDKGRELAKAKIRQKNAARPTDDSAPKWAQVPKNYRPTLKEQEQLTELSKATVKSYVKKASTSLKDIGTKAKVEKAKADMATHLKDPEDAKRHGKAYTKAANKWSRRWNSVEKAEKKIAEENINEIDMKAMSNAVGQSKNVTDKRSEGAHSPYSSYSMVDRTKQALDKMPHKPKTDMGKISGRTVNPNAMNNMAKSATKAFLKSSGKI